MKALLLALLMLMPTAVFANTITKDDLSGFNTLTDMQKAEIIVQIAQATELNDLGGITSILDTPVQPEQVDEWVDLGVKVGKMLGGTAKELGIAANEFATSPLGIITMGLIIWNYAGSDLYGFILGTLWFIIFIPIWIMLFFKIAYPITDFIDYNKIKGDKTIVAQKPLRKLLRDNEDDAFVPGVFVIVLVAIFIVGIIFLM